MLRMSARPAQKAPLRARMYAALKSEKGFVDADPFIAVGFVLLVGMMLAGGMIVSIILSTGPAAEEQSGKEVILPGQEVATVVEKTHDEPATITETVCETVDEVTTCDPATETQKESWWLVLENDETKTNITIEVPPTIYDEYNVGDTYVLPEKE